MVPKNSIVIPRIIICMFVIFSKVQARLGEPTHIEISDEDPGFFSTNQIPEYEEDLKHECNRECHGDSTVKKCHYKFKAEWYMTMSKACYDCPFNVTDCLRPHCVVVDAIERPIVTVNRRIPGPSIYVCEGDEIIVDVINQLVSDSTSIHWHGIHQVGTPYMDGVPLLTQCPIDGGTSFRYHFIADPPGTHYWHSHSGFQRADGMFGSLIVRSRNDSHRSLYDFDDPDHVVFITDWSDKLLINKFLNHHHTLHENLPYNLLINGLGKYKPLRRGNESANAPIYEYHVKSGYQYRFRSISNIVQNCPIEISVDNHTLLVISSDGRNIEPLEVDSLVIYGGERWDFVINANQTPGVYWVKFRGLLACDENFLSVYQIAVLRYDGQKGFPNKPQDVNYDFTRRKGLQLNTLNEGPGDRTTFYTAADIRNKDNFEETSAYDGEPDHKIYLESDFYPRDDEWVHHKDFYPFYGVKSNLRLFMPQMNNITFKLPNVPPLSQPEEVDKTQFCNQSSVTNCSENFCHCTHIYHIEFGSLVEIILIDIGAIYWANHPFHLHGHAFAVLGMERIGANSTTLEEVKNWEKSKKLIRNFKNPPIKDSVTVPDGGYTVIRFIANNPGYWLFHCHLTFHLETGMAVIFHVGNQEHLPPVPKGFPKCGSWLPEPVNDLHDEISKLTSEVTFGNPFSRTKYSLISDKNPESTSQVRKEVPQVGGTIKNTMSLIIICFMVILNVLI